MSATTISGVKDSGSSNSDKRWAALDSRLERLANPADRLWPDSDGQKRDCELKAAS